MPRRSRGCEACRKRRIGCDGKQPTCGQCLVNNRSCSGPLQGPIIINQTSKVISRNSGGDQKLANNIRQSRATEIVLVSQPPSGPFASIAFIAEFFAFTGNQEQKPSKESWLAEAHHGPGAPNATGPASPLHLAMEATALAYCGSASNNSAAVRQACAIYGSALGRLSGSLSRGSAGSEPALVFTSAILAMFEAIFPTTTTAYAMHLAAAWRMMASISWRLESSLLLTQVAGHLQFQTLYIMVAYPAEYLTAAPAARQCNQLGRQRYETSVLHERFMVDLFDLTDCFAVKNCYPSGQISCESGLIQRVLDLWQEYEHEAEERGELLEWSSAAGDPNFRDVYTAFVVAYFAAASIIISLIDDGGRLHGSSIGDPYDAVLRCTAYLTTTELGCAGLRMFFPLTLVANWGPSHSQRLAAYKYITEWLQGATFKGLGVTAVEFLKGKAS